MNIWERIVDFFQDIVDEIRMNIALSLFDNTPETRLKWLRRTYYRDPDVTVGHRRIKEVLREHVHKTYFGYYERLLTSERAAHQMIRKLPHKIHGDDLMDQMQRLGDKVVYLIEQVQSADEMLKLYPAHSAEAQAVQESHDWLIARIEDALSLHATIPARLLAFGTMRAGRGIDRLEERIARLTTSLDDIADAYAEIDSDRSDGERRQLESEIQAAIRHLESGEEGV